VFQFDSQFSHLAWIQTTAAKAGLGDIAYPTGPPDLEENNRQFS